MTDSNQAKLFDELPNEILKARDRIKAYVRKTPLMHSPFLSKDGDCYIKLESEQVSGSFKDRGANNKILKMREEDESKLKEGLTTASSGNHALACVFATKRYGYPLDIYCSTAVTKGKIKVLEAYGATVRIHGNDGVEAELKAREVAKEQSLTYISPYNDYDVAAGQGTIGIEILEDLPDVDVVIVPVGGGGLIAGMARYLKHHNPAIKVIGCQPEKSKVMYECVKAGKIVFEESFETLSDGTSGAVEEGSITFPLCRDYVDEWILVTEEEIAQAIHLVLSKHHKLVEGSAGVAVASYLKHQDQFNGKKVVLVACGSNISTATLKHILNTYEKD